MFSLESSGSFDNTETFLKKMSSGDIFNALSRYGQVGVEALSHATPQDTGLTSISWYYEILNDGKSWSIIWGNSHMEEGQLIAVLIQYGHGTRNGGYVQGRDYINPALQPVFDEITSDAWKAVTAA